MFLLTVQSWICSQSSICSHFFRSTCPSFPSPLSHVLFVTSLLLSLLLLSTHPFSALLSSRYSSVVFAHSRNNCLSSVWVCLCKCVSVLLLRQLLESVIKLSVSVSFSGQLGSQEVLILYQPFELIASGSMAWLRVDTRHAWVHFCYRYQGPLLV